MSVFNLPPIVTAPPSRRARLRFSRRDSRGVSLLELILALALAVVVFSAISLAIQTHVVSLRTHQSRIERKQVSRACLAMIANDCRAAIQHKAADFSGLDNLMKSQQMMMNDAITKASGGGAELGGDEESDDGESGGSGNGNTGSGSTNSGQNAGASSGGEDEETQSLYDEELVSFRPVLIGSSSSLMMDVSRVPRLDQYSPLITSAANLSQSPSDIKSIAYFCSSSDGGSKSEIQFETAAQGGLYRREVDRAVAAFNSEPRTMSTPDTNTKLVSPEIAEIEFRYFDGNGWRTSWNSLQDEGFPLAIEVTIVIDPARISRNNRSYAYRGFDKQTMEMYRTVVHLPLSEVKQEK